MAAKLKNKSSNRKGAAESTHELVCCSILAMVLSPQCLRLIFCIWLPPITTEGEPDEDTATEAAVHDDMLDHLDGGVDEDVMPLLYADA